MKIGRIANNRPITKIVMGTGLGIQEMVVVMDTGFSGGVKIPKEKVSELGIEVTHTEYVSLADNRKVPMEAGLALVVIEGITKVVDVLMGEGVPLIGIGLLKKFKYNLHLYSTEDRLEFRR